LGEIEHERSFFWISEPAVAESQLGCIERMAIFPFKTDEKSEAFCHSIAREMTKLFGISEHEAIHRIGRFWKRLPEIVGEQDIVYHETEDYWARTIYYGKDSFWWITDRASRHLPPLTPLPLD
jgi:hypothetical protein